MELKITLLGLALAAIGYGYLARYESNDLLMTKALLDAKADPNLCWQKWERSRFGGEAWTSVHPLERALENKRGNEIRSDEQLFINNEELLLLISYGSKPPSEKVASELERRKVLSSPKYWLRRFGVVHVLPPEKEQAVIRFLIVVRECQPRLYKDVVGLIVQRIARVL